MLTKEQEAEAKTYVEKAIENNLKMITELPEEGRWELMAKLLTHHGLHINALKEELSKTNQNFDKVCGKLVSTMLLIAKHLPSEEPFSEMITIMENGNHPTLSEIVKTLKDGNPYSPREVN